MRLFGIIFLSVGLLMLFIGIGWFKLEYEHIMAGVDEAIIGPAVFLFLGFVFGGIGGGVLFNQYQTKKKRETLVRTGRKIEAVITEIGLNRSISINRRHPYVVTCKGNVSGKEMTFRSNNVFGNLLLKVGDKLPVYVDFYKQDKYWVEVPDEAVGK